MPTQDACSLAASAPAAPHDEHTRTAYLVWNRLFAPFHAMTGRDVRLHVVAREHGGKMPRAPFLCGPPGGPAVVVPRDFLDTICLDERCYAGSFPLDFLAFVLAHELAHRARHTDDAGRAFATCAIGDGPACERQADRAAAFYLTMAGFSARRVAREDLVTGFLQFEAALWAGNPGSTDAGGRKAELVRTLAGFDTQELLFEAAVVVAFAGDPGAADVMLGWADGGMEIPEVSIWRAITMTMRSARDAPWTDPKPEFGSFSPRCVPLFPAHAVIWNPDTMPALRGTASERVEAARNSLMVARNVLDRARASGGDPFTVAAARGCVDFYLGDTDAAAADWRAARTTIPEDAPGTVKAILVRNESLTGLAAFLRHNPQPVAGSPEARSWTDRLARSGALKGADSDTMAWIARLEGRDAVPVRPAAAATPGRCRRGGEEARVVVSSLAEAVAGFRKMESTLADCAPGWNPWPSSRQRVGGESGLQDTRISVCESGQAGSVRRSLRLFFTPEDGIGAFPMVMNVVMYDRPAGAGRVEDWACACAETRQVGISPSGLEAHSWRCQAVVAEQGVFFARNDGTIMRAATVTVSWQQQR